MSKKNKTAPVVSVKALVAGSLVAVHIPEVGPAWVRADDFTAAIVRIAEKRLMESILKERKAYADNEKVGNDGWALDESGYISKPLSPDAPQQPQEARTEAGAADLAECAPAGSGIAWGGNEVKECLQTMYSLSRKRNSVYVVLSTIRGLRIVEIYGISGIDNPPIWLKWAQVGNTTNDGFWVTYGHPGPQRKVNSDGSTEELED